jgi:phosphoribosylanthranilate isomerase
MALSTHVLVSNITNLSEARYCSGMGVQFLAFPINSVDPQLFRDITGWIKGPKMILDVSASHQVPLLNEYEADYILVNEKQFNSLPSDWATLTIVKYNSGSREKESLLKRKDKIAFLLAEGLNKSELQNLALENFQVFMMITEDTIHYLTEPETWPVQGVVLSGMRETKPGLMDYDHLSSILEKLEVNED